MSDIAIKVESLGKKYKIGKKKSGDLRESVNLILNRFRNKVAVPEEAEFWALQDINFEIKQGEAVGVIGRNGAGKSTLLKILSRITEPTTGRIEINGRVSSLLEVGTGFHPELTGRENIFLNGTILGMKRREVREKFDEIVDFSGVEKFIDTPIKHYSSGMKVRLAFSVAAHLEPEILLIDEVLAVGDAEFQKKCLGKMEDVTGEGRTVVFVSHNMGAVQSLCSSGVLLLNGQIICNQPISHAVNMYFNSYKLTKSKSYENKIVTTEGVAIEGVRVLNSSEVATQELIPGEQVFVEIEYSSKMDVLNNLIVGCVISNSLGQFICVLNNKMANYYWKSVKGNGVIRCIIPKLPLMSGEYYLDINIYANEKQQLYIERVSSIDVQRGDFYGSGFPNNKNRQGIYIDQSWDIA